MTAPSYRGYRLTGVGAVDLGEVVPRERGHVASSAGDRRSQYGSSQTRGTCTRSHVRVTSPTIQICDLVTTLRLGVPGAYWNASDAMNPGARCRAGRPCLEGSKSRNRLSDVLARPVLLFWRARRKHAIPIHLVPPADPCPRGPSRRL